MAASVETYPVTGMGALALATTAVPAGRCFRLESVDVHFSAAPAAAGSLTVTRDSVEGPEYDTLLQSASMVGLTDWLWLPDGEILLAAGDVIDVAYTNPDARTYGVRVTLKEVW